MPRSGRLAGVVGVGRRLSAVEDYLDLPYEITVVRRDGEDGMYWTARVDELGCEARGSRASEAMKGVRRAMERRIGEVLADGGSVPRPRARPAAAGCS